MPDCCARTASGHAAAAPHASLLNSRRLIRSLRRRAAVTIRLGCAVPVRRVKGGWYFQVIEVIGLNPGTLQGRANLLAEELGQLYDLKE